MSPPADPDPFARLERAFHEPKRLAIMSALIGAEDQEMSFGDLKTTCDLTDGNLNRHLRTLEETGAVAFRKSGREGRPQTLVSLTVPGRRAFVQYLDALEEVLRKAAAAVSRETAPARVAEALPRPARP